MCYVARCGVNMCEEQKAALQRDYIRKNHPHWFPFGGSVCALCMLMEESDELREKCNNLIEHGFELNNTIKELSKVRELKPEPVTDLPKPKKKRAQK